MDELHAELTCPDGLPRLAGDELDLIGQAVLLQLEPDEAGGHTGGVDGRIDVPHQVGDAADVVLVAVGDEDGPDPVPVLDEVGEVGDDHVDAVHVIVGEAHSCVHHNDVAAVLVHGEVLADLVQTAKGNNLQFFCHKYSFSYSAEKDRASSGQ